MKKHGNIKLELAIQIPRIKEWKEVGRISKQ